MGKMIGIDLGTSNSVVAIVDGPTPRVIDNREARSQTRSVVGIKKRRGPKAETGVEILVGDPAVDNWPMAPRDTILSIKRLMGRGIDDPEVQRIREWALYDIVEPSDGTRDSVRVVMGGKAYSPIDISAIVLRKLKEDAEFRLGEPITHAVITVPAYFSQIQRDATRKAGVKAGLRVIKILEEPTAAAIAGGLESGDGSPKTVLVYDLGGGTFDISVLMAAGNVFAPLNLEGDMWLGGDNLDALLVDHAVRHVKDEYGLDPGGNARFMAELKKAAQTVKERLSATETADLLVIGVLQDADGNLIDLELEVTRLQFERMMLPLVDRYRACSCGQANFAQDETCARCTRSLGGVPVSDGRAVQLVRRALEHPSVNMTPDQVDYVLMAGSSTNIPLVQRSMEQMFGAQKVLRKVHPKHSVALGAALVAAWRGGQCVCQAPDPADPTRECGHVNKDDAEVCASCGAPANLGALDGDSEVEGESVVKKSQPGVLGGIAPFSYGVQTIGDRMQVFIKKGDPFPTEAPLAQIFRTRVPKQRMVSLPIFGGDHLDRASANEKQGEAFAVLPANLPQGTPIRVRVQLDSDGIFELTAHLDDGTDLAPWIVKGEVDAKAIKAIEQIEQIAGEKGRDLSPAANLELERARARAFEKMREQDFAGAESEAAQILKGLAPGPEQVTLKMRAQNLTNWIDFVLQQYGWCVPPEEAARLDSLARQARAALAAGDQAVLQARVDELEDATRFLPEQLDLLLGLRHVISSRVRLADPRRAAELMRRLEQVEHGLRTGRSGSSTTMSPQDALEALTRDVTATLEEGREADTVKCSKGHHLSRGARNCPTCGEDTWSLESGPAGKAGSGTR